MRGLHRESIKGGRADLHPGLDRWKPRHKFIGFSPQSVDDSFQASPCAFSTTEAPGAPVDDVVEHAHPVALKESMIAALGVERTPAVDGPLA